MGDYVGDDVSPAIRRWLLVGGAGFIGSHLADALLSHGGEVLIFDDLSTGSLRNVEHLEGHPRVTVVEGSALDLDAVRDCMSRVDACMHLAAPVGVRLIMEQPLTSLQRSIKSSDVVISTAAELGRPLLFASSSEIYGKNHTEAVTEIADTKLGPLSSPRWWYAVAKAYGESLSCAYVRQLAAPIVVARLFNTVGPRQTGKYGMVVPRLVSQAIRGEPLTVYGDGTQSRCFAHVQDTVEALIRLISTIDQLPPDDPAAHIFNVGAIEPVTIAELARRTIERTDSSSDIRFVPFEEVYGDDFDEPGSRRPDVSALHRLTGWSARRTLDDIIDDTSADIRKRGDFLDLSAESVV